MPCHFFLQILEYVILEYVIFTNFYPWFILFISAIIVDHTCVIYILHVNIKEIYNFKSARYMLLVILLRCEPLAFN